jgi:hypothetical protein
MIPKNEMKDGAWYTGFCRNANMAKWDGTRQKFVYLRYKFGYIKDDIEHFEDVAKDRLDGFVPLTEVQMPDWQTINEVKRDIGY